MFAWLIDLAIRLGWKILVATFIFSLIGSLMADGRRRIKDLASAVVKAIELGTSDLYGWLFQKYKERQGTVEEQKES